MELTKSQVEIMESYYADNARKLRRVIDRIVLRFGGIYDKDMDDFYSIGNEAFWSALRQYKDGEMSFDTYLGTVLRYEIKSEMTRRNAEKRGAEMASVDVYETDFQSTPSDSPVEDEVVYRKLVDSLPPEEKILVNLRLAGMKDVEIRKITGWSQWKFYDRLKSLRKILLAA